MLVLEDILEKAWDLPSLPIVALKVARGTEASDACASIIAEIMSQDQALCVRVLRLANSAFFGLNRRISELREAIIVLGLTTIRRLALLSCTYVWLDNMSKVGRAFPKSIWHHSIGMGVAAQEVAAVVAASFEDDAFTAGILADVGITALCATSHVDYPAIFALARTENISLIEAENQVLGLDHGVVGGALAEQWGFPPALVNAIRWHHQADESPVLSPLADCLHVSDFMLGQMCLGLGSEGVRGDLLPEAMARLSLSPDKLETLLDELVARYAKQEEDFRGLLAA